MPIKPRTARLALVAVAAVFFGCEAYYEGGPRASQDEYLYKSTSHQPKTISIVDTSTGEVVWTHEIPVGKQLIMKFYEPKHIDESEVPRMKWAETPLGWHNATLDNEMTVPHSSMRRVDMTLRPAPETANAGS